MYSCIVETPWGTWQMQATDQGLLRVGDCKIPMAEGCCNQVLLQAKCELAEYFAGTRTDFSVPLDPSGTPFQKKVWSALQTIPYGETVSYSQISMQIGNPRAVRAVGQAIGKNPCLVFIPCHRVIGKNGNLTGFSAGLDLKSELLALERRYER